MVDEAALAAAVDEFTATVAGEFEAEDILCQLAQAAIRVLDVDGAGVMAPAGGPLVRFVFATSGEAEGLERLQESLQDGPCTDAAASGQWINISDLSVEGDWPEFQAAAVQVGLRAVTTLPMRARGRTVGVLDLYRLRPVKLDEKELTAAQRLANLATSYLLVTADRDAARAAQAKLAHRAAHDPLTGLPVRWVFLEQVAHALTRLQRNPDQQVAVLFLDIDGLKYVNDTYGHLAGDHLITTCVGRVRAALRPSDLMARIGGDEFVILLEDIGGPADAAAVAQRILDELSAPYRPDGELIEPSASIGVAVTDAAGRTPDELIAHADTAMYAAKQAGRRCYRVFEPSAYAAERARVSSRQELTSALRNGLRRGQLEVHYQPILDLDALEKRAAHALPGGSPAGREVWAVEALARWRHPAQGLLSAGEFVPLAEANGLIVELGSLVLRQACRQMVAWDRDLGDAAPARLFLNLSASELAQRGLVDTVSAVLAETGLAPGRLTLEITETQLFTEPVIAARAVEELRRLGCELAIDDFGTGYSSLSRLVEIPAGTLKVDQSFTRGLTVRADAAAVVSSVLLLGHSLQRTVVVEGVEDAATLVVLRELGVTHGQGYHFARPLPPEELGRGILAGTVGGVGGLASGGVGPGGGEVAPVTWGGGPSVWDEAVAHPADRDDSLRAELAPQVAHVDVHHVGARVEVVAPDAGQHLLAAEHLVGVAQERLQKQELAGGQVDRALPDGRAPGPQVQRHVTGAQHGDLGGAARAEP
ncbi:EAL domain-containing protein [Motilibacter sp. K478]|nr:EAL domain-containing protein [Motilibacter aurantiacus]